jgi:HEAT repeat protein
MTQRTLQTAAVTVAATTAATALAAADQQAVTAFIAKIKDSDDQVRGPAWQSAETIGAPAIRPLADLMTAPEMEVARAAKRGAWRIVRHAGRPGADADRRAVVTELLPLLEGRPTAVRREVLWMLSEIGGDESVQPVAACLAESELREDARAALERIPGAKSLAALQAGLAAAPADYKPALAHSLRVRGVKVAGHPSQKLVPTRSAPAAAPPPR